MQIGIEGKKSLLVTKDLTAEHMHSGEVPVFSTPNMIALMEMTCYDSVAPFLEKDEGTVGTKVNIEHMAATPVGMTVTSYSKLIAIEGRLLRFEVSVRDEVQEIGKGIHERFIIKTDKFINKAYSKLSNN